MVTDLDADPIPLNTRWGPLDVDGAVAQTVVSHALCDSGFLIHISLAIRELLRRNAAFVEVFLGAAAHLLVLPSKGHDVNVPTLCTVQIRRTFFGDPLQAPDTSFRRRAKRNRALQTQ